MPVRSTSAKTPCPLLSLALLVSVAISAWAGTTPPDTPENRAAPQPETSVKAAKPEPLVRKISASTFRIGKITFNKDTREISLPAQTNIVTPDTPLEYLLVHSNGEKIHESLLVTEADPMHVNIALKLLNYRESPELFRLPREDGTPSEKYPEVAEEIKQAARFEVLVTWKDGAMEKTVPATRWIHHRVTGKAMPDTPWVYNGSYVHEQKFHAKITGSILTIFPDVGSIANYPGEDRWDDTLWYPAPGLPEQGAPLRVTLKPWTEKP